MTRFLSWKSNNRYFLEKNLSWSSFRSTSIFQKMMINIFTGILPLVIVRSWILYNFQALKTRKNFNFSLHVPKYILSLLLISSVYEQCQEKTSLTRKEWKKLGESEIEWLVFWYKFFTCTCLHKKYTRWMIFCKIVLRNCN